MHDPFVNQTGGHSYEIALLYLVLALLFVTAGPGRFSLDRKIFGAKT
jgi:putative oxidoreductase